MKTKVCLKSVSICCSIELGSSVIYLPLLGRVARPLFWFVLVLWASAEVNPETFWWRPWGELNSGHSTHAPSGEWAPLFSMDDDDPGGDDSAWGPPSIAVSLSTPSQGQSIVSAKAKASAAKRDDSTAFISFQETNPSKLQKDDTDVDFAFQFDSAFELDFEAIVALDHTSQLSKFKSFFAKLEENAISVKTDKARMSLKINKLEKEAACSITIRSDLESARKDLIIAKLSLADKDIRLFELQNSGKAAMKQHSAPPANSRSAPLQKQPIIPAKSFLIARVRDSVLISSITESKIDNLLGLLKDQEGPVVQQLKKHSENSVKIFFRDEQNRDNARELLDKPEAEKVFKTFMRQRIATQPF
ncbi:hypothetical protein DAPPUDRAFT_118022 [Daphnia pulex]|uniref:Uncharacterized protein n=1 Tax=Daphnia pulex TaxID=6669 RepID=E9HUG8_DAPPU|nr:hypothetical protein DAPPUDRAFT_118022 [Daphnia pulex]|eukprot:EFX64600.1 hypothetical protein DAPPUDRAFT_118022 [Daphnia pulex]